MDDKVIVSHKGALLEKYGAAGVKKIETAVQALIAADGRRGIQSVLVYLDDAKAMKKHKGKAFTHRLDCRAAKAAIDAVATALQPDYLLLLGASDVIPHQDLKNPAYAAGDDPDRVAYSDLPYACEAAYSRDPAKFVGPIRVVGRLPDLTGAREPSHLLALLKTATRAKSRPASAYRKYFGLSAKVWEGSTRLSLETLFGNADGLNLSPPKGPRFAATALGAFSHFINCHGAENTPEFYGQLGDDYPPSLRTRTLRKKIKEGTIAAAECCYGAQLYDSVLLGIDMPVCQSYLAQGAYAYLGSTTIAYGPEDSNALADLITQYFIANLLGGASVGRAALMARQQFVDSAQQMDPFDLKTLAQFCIYGDPSIHPVKEARSSKRSRDASNEESNRFQRSERRSKLMATGRFLQRTKATAGSHETAARPNRQAQATLNRLAVNAGLGAQQIFTAFKVKGRGAQLRGGKGLGAAPSRYYATVARPAGNQRLVAIVAKELDGRIIDYCIYHER